MKIKEYISSRQLFLIIIGYTIGAAFIVITTLKYLKRDTFIVDFLSFLIGIILIFMMSYVIKKYPHDDVGDILEKLFGKIGAYFMMILFLFASFIIGSLTEYHIANLMTGMIMIETPKWIIVIFTTLVTSLILCYGFEATARAIECVYPFLLLLTFILYIIILILMFDYKSFFPFFTEKPIDIIKSLIVSYCFPYADICLLLFVFPLLKIPNDIYKVSLKGILIVGALFMVEGILVVLSFGGTQAQKLAFPFFEVARLLSLGQYFERLEILVLIIWFFSIFIKLSVCIFACAKSLQYIFGLNDYKFLIFPSGLLLIPFGINLITDFDDTRVLYYVFDITTKIPISLLIAIIFIFAIIKKNK